MSKTDTRRKGERYMTMEEKIAALRKEKGITQEAMAESFKVTRQSVSRWKMDAAFPETEKLIRLGRLLGCSIDFLLNGDMQKDSENDRKVSAQDCFRFIRERTYFFLATSVGGRSWLRPMGGMRMMRRCIWPRTAARAFIPS